MCLTEETTEILYRIGAGDCVVGVSGYTVRPPEARRKPKVSAFVTARHDLIESLAPDLVLGFSDLQAEIARELVSRGLPVVVFNQRSVAQILQVVRAVGALVGRPAEADALAEELTANLRRHAEAARGRRRRPRVFFEEWPDPLISGIRWVTELVELVGGQDVCPEVRTEQGAKGRIHDPAEVARRDPEVVVASWCGKKALRSKIAGREGWGEVSAVREDQLYEIKSTYILQPGPAALTDGVDQLAAIVAAVERGDRLPRRRAGDLRRAD